MYQDEREALDLCYVIAGEIQKCWNRGKFEELFDLAYRNGIDVSTDYETYISVEDEYYRVTARTHLEG